MKEVLEKQLLLNALSNYLVYNSLDEAIDRKLQDIIPAWFAYTDKNTYEEKIIPIGTSNERIGNLRDFSQDIKNFEDIRVCIIQFEYLNGIILILEQRKDYSNRWNNTIQEFRRLISRIIKSNKFTIRDTHSLGEVEQLIRKTKLQHFLVDEQYRESCCSLSFDVPIDAKIVPSKYPRTVCTNDKCIRVIIIDDEQKLDYNKKQKKNAGAQNNDVIVDLEKLLINYKHEIHILQQEMIIKPITIFTYSSNFTDVFKSEEVFCVVDSLYPIINQ
ncbi:unnamed protein product [Rotaria sordida]|uniref:Uncharacterized protein n=2 Tax=Rotaria sordida TaxID=392033 RepID=A0A814JZG2_9BILA|nr:unnamed protein product [Rotaria sordida]